MNLLRFLLPLLAGGVCAWWIDRSTAVRGLLPPGFRRVDGQGLRRRVVAMALLGLVLWVGMFAAVGQIGLPSRVDQIDFENLSPLSLFLMHAVLVVTLAAWLMLGYWRCGHDAGKVIRSQLGLQLRPGQSGATEVGLGFAAGIVLWVGVLIAMLIAALAAGLAGGFENLDEAPTMVLWMGSLPVLIRLMLSLSAGVVEEIFFRGFLMPRVGFGLSNVLFVLGHLSYQQPFQLLGITLLSIAFSLLVRWRGNIWSAIVAHALFDAIQLLVVIPAAAGAAAGAAT